MGQLVKEERLNSSTPLALMGMYIGWQGAPPLTGTVSAVRWERGEITDAKTNSTISAIQR